MSNTAARSATVLRRDRQSDRKPTLNIPGALACDKAEAEQTMKEKQADTGGNKSLTRPVWRVRRKDDPERWLRSFHRENEARAFAREHAIAHGCSMVVQRPSEAELAAWWEF